MRRYETAFTLVEMLLVTVMLSVLGMAVYAALSNGIGLWQAVNRETPQEDINIFFLKMSHDLRNVFKYSGIGFSGGPECISFPTFVTSYTKKGVQERIGCVSYYFDRSGNSVVRTQSDYSQVYLSKPGSVRQLVGNVRSVIFRYYCYDPETEEYLWLDAWDAEEAPPGVSVDKTAPLAVEVKVALDDDCEDKEFSRVVAVPIGG